MEPHVIYEDDNLLVINKPSGMTVNRADTTRGEETVQEWAEDYLKIRNPKSEARNKSKITNSNDQNSFEFRDSNFEFSRRAGIVHRLDKETSGILLIAKTPEAFANLQTQFKERKVKKTYIALVHGTPIEQEGQIRVPVGRLPWNRKQFGVVAGGRDAVTRFRRIRNYELGIMNKKEKLTLVELYPETGRTHQIRVHLKYIGHPIVSDELYAGRKTARADRKMLPRLFLHAAKISFFHPKNGEVITLKSPLPSELLGFLALLRG
ncbi:MAG: RluA family pseudouridine synthase [Candidatus Levybacteria bacterium]|nr:RluA family pseudouridine synthase [Candidatus Levybacteria bacterium]